MKARRDGPRVLVLALLTAGLSACAAGVLPGLAGDGCRTVYVLSGGTVQPVNTCGGLPRETLQRVQAVPPSGADLAALLAAPKFKPDAYYAGVDDPADEAPLTKAVNDAVRDMMAMPEPRNANAVRTRLRAAVAAVAPFATEDREHAYMYLVLAWRAAGLAGETGLFPSDEQVIRVF